MFVFIVVFMFICMLFGSLIWMNFGEYGVGCGVGVIGFIICILVNIGNEVMMFVSLFLCSCLCYV